MKEKRQADVSELICRSQLIFSTGRFETTDGDMKQWDGSDRSHGWVTFQL